MPTYRICLLEHLGKRKRLLRGLYSSRVRNSNNISNGDHPRSFIGNSRNDSHNLNSRLRISIQGSPFLGISIRKMQMDSYYSFFKRLLRRFLTRKVHSSQHIPRPS